MKNIAASSELLLLDFDGTFYRFSEAFLEHCNESAARAALRLGAPLSLDQARRMAADSYAKFGSSLTLFHREYGFRPEDCHEVFHDELEPRYVEECQVTAAHLQTCHVPMALLSHSNRPWILHMLEKFGLAGCFDPARIFALEDVGFHLKVNGPESYLCVLQRLNAEPKRTVMVEDSVRNLEPAKQLGMTTVYVTQDRPFEPAHHPMVDYVFRDLPEFLSAFAEEIS